MSYIFVYVFHIFVQNFVILFLEGVRVLHVAQKEQEFAKKEQALKSMLEEVAKNPTDLSWFAWRDRFKNHYFKCEDSYRAFEALKSIRNVSIRVLKLSKRLETVQKPTKATLFDRKSFKIQREF